MKAKILFLSLLFLGLVGFSQSQESLINAAGINGCNDARTPGVTMQTYYSVMQNPSISRQYKEAYDLGWTRCKGSSSWVVDSKLGKLVYQEKSSYSNGTHYNENGKTTPPQYYYMPIY